jgi:hypothetical protein
MWQPSCLVPIPWRRLLAIVLVALTAVVVALALARVLRDDDAPSARLVPASGEPPGSGAEVVDPLAWTEDRSASYAAAAARGLAHPLYAQSPGGVLATARRVDRYRPVVESIARSSGLDPDTMEAMVFLRTPGRRRKCLRECGVRRHRVFRRRVHRRSRGSDRGPPSIAVRTAGRPSAFPWSRQHGARRRRSTEMCPSREQTQDSPPTERPSAGSPGPGR